MSHIQLKFAYARKNGFDTERQLTETCSEKSGVVVCQSTFESQRSVFKHFLWEDMILNLLCQV